MIQALEFNAQIVIQVVALRILIIIFPMSRD